MMTTVVRNAIKHLTLISDNSPYATHNITIPSEVGDYESQGKATAHLNTTINRGYIENNPINNQIRARYVQKPVELILNELSFIPIQTIYTLQTNMKMKIGNYDLRDGIITCRSKQNKDIHGSECQFEILCYLKQPIKESDIEMYKNKTKSVIHTPIITLGKFYKLVRNRLNLSRYPKSKIKQTSLALIPTGNLKMWYFGVMYDPKGDKKVTWIPYLSGNEDQTTLKAGEIGESDKYNDEQQRTLSTIGQKWNYDEFDYARQPIDIGTVMDRYAFSSPMPNVVNLPIKMAGDDTIYLPVEYEGMNEALNKIFTYEKAVNLNYDDYYAYLTVDKFLEENSQSRVKYHVDGFQSTDQTDLSVQHNYTVSNVEVPNKFVVETVKTGVLNGETISKWFDSFTRQSEHVKKMESIPLHIYLYDAYQIHTSTHSMETSDRNYTYMSVSFTKRQLNRIGNGINPLINEEWTYTPQDMEAEVTE